MPKIVVVTGASSGLGRCIALQAARKGHSVYATIRNLKHRDGIEAEANSEKVSLNTLRIDVQSEDSIVAAVDQIFAEHGRIDTWINNAGAGYICPTEQASLEDVKWVMDVNFMGVVRCTKAVLPKMRREGTGHIINISSVGGLVGQPFREFYCASKSAVEGYTETLSCYVTPSFGINFTLVEPGGMATGFAEAMRTHMEAIGGLPAEDYLPVFKKHLNAAKHLGAGASQNPNEVAEVVVRCIEQAEPPVRLRTSQWAEDLCDLKTHLDPDGTKIRAKIASEFL